MTILFLYNLKMNIKQTIAIHMITFAISAYKNVVMNIIKNKINFNTCHYKICFMSFWANGEEYNIISFTFVQNDRSVSFWESVATENYKKSSVSLPLASSFHKGAQDPSLLIQLKTGLTSFEPGHSALLKITEGVSFRRSEATEKSIFSCMWISRIRSKWRFILFQLFLDLFTEQYFHFIHREFTIDLRYLLQIFWK